jgi:hypothetical protein
MKEIAIFYAWKLDEDAAACKPDGPFACNNVLRLDSLLNGKSSILALDRRYFHSRWAVEERTDCFWVPGL